MVYQYDYIIRRTYTYINNVCEYYNEIKIILTYSPIIMM